MCGKMVVISGEHDSNQNRVLVEQNDGISYTFDTTDSAMMFKRLSSVYGSDIVRLLRMNSVSIVLTFRSIIIPG